jgi:hypothetical protein
MRFFSFATIAAFSATVLAQGASDIPKCAVSAYGHQERAPTKQPHSKPALEAATWAPVLPLTLPVFAATLL